MIFGKDDQGGSGLFKDCGRNNWPPPSRLAGSGGLIGKRAVVDSSRNCWKNTKDQWMNGRREYRGPLAEVG